MVFGIDHSEDAETCDEVCGERHSEIALIFHHCVTLRDTFFPESLHGKDSHNGPKHIEDNEQADTEYDL